MPQFYRCKMFKKLHDTVFPSKNNCISLYSEFDDN